MSGPFVGGGIDAGSDGVVGAVGEGGSDGGADGVGGGGGGADGIGGGSGADRFVGGTGMPGVGLTKLPPCANTVRGARESAVTANAMQTARDERRFIGDGPKLSM